MAVSKSSAGKKQQKKLPSWMMGGQDAEKAFEKEDAETKARREANARLFRFRVKPGETTSVTFVDGDVHLTGPKKGSFVNSVPVVYEHTVKTGPKKWDQYLCIAEDEPCPFCASDNRRYICAVFTVIDHSEWTSRKGETYTNQRKLFVAKSQTYKKLKKRAAKHGALTGWTVEISRTDDRSAAVGDEFEWEDQQALTTLADEYDLPEILEGTDYVEELPYHSGEELRTLGFADDLEDPDDADDSEGDSLPESGDTPF